MKRLACLAFVMIFVVASTACAQAPAQPSDGIINPGDKVGNFVITSAEGEDITYATQLQCPLDEATATESCEVPVGTKVNVSQGVVKPFVSGFSLDELWSGMTYEMSIDGFAVDLQAFGYDEFEHEVVGTVRVWDVVVSTARPGQLTIHSTGEVGGFPIENTAVITFVESSK